jgi:hypothetical protein
MKMNAQYASMQCRGTTKRRRKASTNVFVTHRFYALFCLFLYFNQSDHPCARSYFHYNTFQAHWGVK